ncbi:MAG TPA: VWA domain-containing protein [Methanosphaera sp.]|nr:VWA domain-containing protein [Methanosphaera sp.]
MVNERIVALSNQLREEGVSVSVRSTKTACDVWNLMKGSTDIKDMQYALKTVYIKDTHDEQKFDDIFEELFAEPEEGVKHTTKEESDSPFKDPAIEQEDIMGLPDSQISEIPIEQMIPPEFDAENLQQNKIHEKDLLKSDINHLNTFDERIVDLCRKLGKKIANSRARRKRLMKSNNINMPRTIRTNLKNGGKLIDIVYAKPKLNKTKHIFLNDVSGSCDWISNWFFSIIYGCQRSFDKISCFEFDSKVIETTDALKTESYEISYEAVTLKKLQRGMIHGQSDMAASFKEFLARTHLNHRTTVIILSDCRDWQGKREDGILESAVILKEIVTKSAKVLIFNPEPESKWDTPTSCVRDYQNAGAEVYEIKNLDHLARLITDL